MNITVLGLWHLGCVTAACAARHFHVVGLDFDEANLDRLNSGQAPLFEPGLNELIAAGIAGKSLRFTGSPELACPAADVLWVCYDTPVNEQDESDSVYVMVHLRRALLHLSAGSLVLISSQLPVGTCRQLESEFPQFHFACSPENLRLGRAIDAFERAERVVVGIRDEMKSALLEELFAPFTSRVIFMRTESAEMVKHALNSFLALSITFINEIASLCEHVGADAKEVSAGLKSEPRIGPKSYLSPGGAFAGGTLARDVVALTKLADVHGEIVSVIPSIKQSNDLHRGWAWRQLKKISGKAESGKRKSGKAESGKRKAESGKADLVGKSVAVLGLTYTPNTDTLRRSAAVELIQKLLEAGAEVRAFDPAVTELPSHFSKVRLVGQISEALENADAAVVCTEWPQFREADWSGLVQKMRDRVFVDANRFLEKELKTVPGVEHLSVGCG